MVKFIGSFVKTGCVKEILEACVMRSYVRNTDRLIYYMVQFVSDGEVMKVTFLLSFSLSGLAILHGEYLNSLRTC